jgi:hypothetical protein
MAWWRRPRIHPAVLNKPERAADLVRILGSDERLMSFKALVAAYQGVPSLENYLRLRREFPNVEIDVALYGGIDALCALEPHLKKHEIDPQLVAGVLDASEPKIDELSLLLMERLVARGKLPKNVPGHIEKRRQAISDPLVDYLIVIMLDAMEWNKTHPIVIPSSLIVLIRDRLCGTSPDLLKECHLKEAQEHAAFLAAQRLKQDEKLSIGKLAAVVGISESKVERWLRDESFREEFDSCRKMVASEDFQRQRAAFIAAHHFATNARIPVEKLAILAGVSSSVAERWVADKKFQRWLDFGRKKVASQV